MAEDIVPNTPFANAIQGEIQTKLAQNGWSEDDSSLAEYIVLLLANGKTQDELAAELGSDILTLEKDDPGPKDFARWLFDRVLTLQKQGNETQDATVPPVTSETSQAPLATPQDAPSDNKTSTELDVEMDGDAEAPKDESIPTGPKSMRNPSQRPRERRVLNQMNRAMDRSNEQSIHRIKGTAGTGRINTHSREPPKGPAPKGPRASMNRHIAMQQQQQQQQPMNAPNMSQMQQGNPFPMMTPQQQMQLFAMYEEQARMMAQILSPQQHQQMFANQMGFGQSGMGSNQQQQQNVGKSLFDRVSQDGQKLQARGNSFNNGVEHMNGENSNEIDPTSSMEVESSSQNNLKSEPNNTMCRFNLSCTKPDCYFVHQSPAAPAGVAIDMTDTCSFGAACKNRKCTGKHPSPASLAPQRAEQECKFFPNCTNPMCPFKHPTMPPCRNGADCKVSGCKFSHSKTICKFDPCLNPACPYRHAEGQKRGTYADKVWTSGTGEATTEGMEGYNDEQKAHVSERKFVNAEEGDEELVLPGTDAEASGQPAEGVVT